MDDVTFAHNRPAKGDANTAHTKTDSTGEEPTAKSDAYDCFVSITLNISQDTEIRFTHESIIDCLLNPVYTIPPVVKPVDQPVVQLQPLVRFDNRG